MKKIAEIIVLSLMCIYMVSRMPVFAWGFSDDNYYGEEFYGEEPDITDGDLEDKIGDWGLYEDLFSEDYEDDYDDEESYNYTYVPRKNNKNYEHIDKSTTDYYYTGTSCGNENKLEYNKSVKNPKVYSGGRWVKRTNWHDNAWKPKYMEDWYYYPAGSTESLKLTWAYIDDILYFFNIYGWMTHDSYNWVNGKMYQVDSNGANKYVCEWD